MTGSSARLLLGTAAISFLLTGCGVLGSEEPKTLTARFDRTVGLYEQSDVRILGVKVGQVTKIVPEGDQVRVEMSYDPKYDVPADAKALVVAPSIVSDRYVQLTPVFTGGAVLEDGATLSKERTAVPVELDQIYDAFNEINLSLGPKGANQNGALSDLLEVSARNLEGNGDELGSTLTDFSQGLTALSDSRAELFGTVANLADFSNTIATRDDTVRAFNRDLADVASQLEGEREDLALAVRNLSVALGEVATFVKQNEGDLTKNIADLAEATRFLDERRPALEEFLTVSATALSNLQLAGNTDSGTLDTRDNNFAQTEQNPAGVLCELLETAGQSPEECRKIAEALTGVLPLPGNETNGAKLTAPAAAAKPSAPAGPVVVPPMERDMTLGGILDGGR